MPGRASGIKMVGMAEVGTPVSQNGVAVHPDCWCICLCYLHFAPENPEDGKQRYDIWISLHGLPTCLRKQEVRKSYWNAAVLIITEGWMECGKAGDFRSVPGMLTH